MNHIKNKFLHNPTQTISLSFIMVILIGTGLLMLPISNRGESTSFVNHLFVATSATCVTGLVPVTVADQYTMFGYTVIILLIQIGGLGFLTLLMLFFVTMKKRLSFSSRLLMSQAINQSNLDNINDFLKYIIKYTFVIEGLGALCLFPVFMKDYSLIQSIYYSIWHSISGFCNAGFDILGPNSLINYNQNPWVLFVIASLITLGGIGFLVAKEIQEKVAKHKGALKKLFKSFGMHTKLVLIVSTILIFGGGLIIWLIEKDNPQTIGQLPLFHQITNSLFQSVTYRTAGFITINQTPLADATKLIGCIIMFIGGSPAGTAGGIKTLTFATLCLTVRAVLKGEKEVVVFSRTISKENVMNALCVICLSLGITITTCIVISIIEPFGMIDIMYEVFSAFCTVGLTADVTSKLTSLSKYMIIMMMYIGRIGPVAMMLTLMKKAKAHQNEIKYPEGDILIG